MNEPIIYQTRKSMIIFITPLIWTFVAGFCFYQSQLLMSPINSINPFFSDKLPILILVPAIVAVASWLNEFLNLMTSKFSVTASKVNMQEGFFFRHATETRLSAIAELQITQSLTGRLLNYGDITINSFGGNGETFMSVRDPYQFKSEVSKLLKP